MREVMKQARSALKELVAQTEGRLFAIKHDHFAMQDARAAIRRLDEAIDPVQHWSDCAVHSEPAYPKGECNCGGYKEQA